MIDYQIPRTIRSNSRTGKLYTKPTTTNHPLHTNRFLCASGTPQSKTITFGVKIDNHPRTEIIL